MSWSKKWLAVLLALTIYGCSPIVNKEDALATSPPKHLLEVDALQRINEADSVKIIDLRKPEEYTKNHLPGAINIWRSDIEDDSLPYDGMIASRKKMEALLSKLGIRNTDFLVIYDNNASCDAARLWWVLDYYGFTRTALLNGGLRAWDKVADLVVDVPKYPATTFVFPEQTTSHLVIKLSDLLTEIQDSSLVIIDTRTIEEYRGDLIKKGAFEKGRILGSVHIEWMESVNYKEGTFKSIDELERVFNAHGVNSTTNVVTYCHSGVRSSHTLFVLTQLLGYKTIRNYDGSWVEWSFNKLPYEVETQNR
jgi:thiosulfate/3-mercaptopyruvate sulfurtransferase